MPRHALAIAIYTTVLTLLPAQQPKIPSTDVHREIGDCLRASCRTEMENARPGEGVTLTL